MKVLHVLDHSVPVLSGYSFRSRSIVTFQRRLGLHPVVLTSPKHGTSAAPVEEHDGIRHYRTSVGAASRLGRGPVVGGLMLMARLARRIAQVARLEGAEMIHAHSPVLNGLPALLASRWLRLPLVYEARAFWEDAAVEHATDRAGSLRYRVTRGLETLLFRRADAGVVICEGMRRDLLRRGTPPERLHVVPNGVDTEWFQPRPRDGEAAARLGLNGGPVFGFIGSFYRYEGLQFLLEGVPELRRRIPDSRFLLVGSGNEERDLRRLAAGLGDAVVMPGSVPHDQVRQLYSLIDVFVCPRRRSRLTELVTPLKPLEAMAMERLVVASDVGGHAELIQPEVTGLLFRADSLESFVSQAIRAGTDAGLRQRLGQSARATLVKERSWDRIVGRYPAIYGGCRAGHGRR